MQFVRPISLLAFTLAGTGLAVESLDVRQAQSCAAEYTICQPSGATASVLPSVGSALAPLYSSFLSSVQGVKFAAAKRSVNVLEELAARDTTHICCDSTTDCLKLDDFNIPFCYDPFTTNFYLADGSTGTLDNGTLNVARGPVVDLIKGGYSDAGTTGNIYGTSAALSTGTLDIPSPYTSSGVGGAIPLSALAGLVTLTTTLPATTVPPCTLAATTATNTFVVSPTTTIIVSTAAVPPSKMIATSTTVVVSGTTVTTSMTEPATTIPGTTIPATVVTLTTAVPSPAKTSSGNNASALNGIPSNVLGAGLIAAFLAALAI